MRTTPNLGLEFADGSDPLKQYPAAVDEPSKTKIDTWAAGINTEVDKIQNPPYASITSGNASYPSGTTKLAAPVFAGTIPAANGVLTIPTAGWYEFSWTQTVPTTPAVATVAYAGVLTGTDTAAGTTVARNHIPASIATAMILPGMRLVQFNAGSVFVPWLYTNAARDLSLIAYLYLVIAT